MGEVVRVVNGAAPVLDAPAPVPLAPGGDGRLPTVAPPDDEFQQLLAAAIAGDEAAWASLYGRVASNLRSYAAAQGAQDPDDVVGEVFVQVARNIGRFKGTEAGFRSWVFMIAHSRVLDVRRAARRRPPPVQLDELILDLRTATEPDAESAALDRLAIERVHALLAGLTDDQRQVLLLRYLGDLTLEEVATVTSRPVGAVKQLHRRGLRAIRRNMAQAVPG